jgi:hypothetical protein
VWQRLCGKEEVNVSMLAFKYSTVYYKTQKCMWHPHRLVKDTMRAKMCIYLDLEGSESISHFKKTKHDGSYLYFFPMKAIICLFLLIVYTFIHMCICCLGHLSPPFCPSLLPYPSCFQAELVLPSSLILLKRKHKRQ